MDKSDFKAEEAFSVGDCNEAVSASGRVAWLDRELSRAPYFIGVVTSKKGYREAIEHCGFPPKSQDPWISENASGTVHMLPRTPDGKDIIIVSLDVKSLKKLDVVEQVGICVHEAVHVWQYIRSAFNIGSVDEIGDEFEAYAVQKIAGRIFGAYLAQTVKD